MPVPPVLPDPTPQDTAAAVAVLADAASQASIALFDYRRDHPDAPDAMQARNLEKALDQRSIDLLARSIALLGPQAADALAQMKEAARRVDDFLARVKVGQARLAIADAVIALAGATLAGDAGGILTAVVGVHDALKSAQAAQAAPGAQDASA
jgi:hypothetical protein